MVFTARDTSELFWHQMKANPLLSIGAFYVFYTWWMAVGGAPPSRAGGPPQGGGAPPMPPPSAGPLRAENLAPVLVERLLDEQRLLHWQVDRLQDALASTRIHGTGAGGGGGSPSSAPISARGVHKNKDVVSRKEGHTAAIAGPAPPMPVQLMKCVSAKELGSIMDAVFGSIVRYERSVISGVAFKKLFRQHFRLRNAPDGAQGESEWKMRGGQEGWSLEGRRDPLDHGTTSATLGRAMESKRAKEKGAAIRRWWSECATRRAADELSSLS